MKLSSSFVRPFSSLNLLIYSTRTSSIRRTVSFSLLQCFSLYDKQKPWGKPTVGSDLYIFPWLPWLCYQSQQILKVSGLHLWSTHQECCEVTLFVKFCAETETWSRSTRSKYWSWGGSCPAREFYSLIESLPRIELLQSYYICQTFQDRTALNQLKLPWLHVGLSLLRPFLGIWSLPVASNRARYPITRVCQCLTDL